MQGGAGESGTEHQRGREAEPFEDQPERQSCHRHAEHRARIDFLDGGCRHAGGGAAQLHHAGQERDQHEQAKQLDDRDSADIGALRLCHGEHGRQGAGRRGQQGIDPGPARDMAQIGAGREHDHRDADEENDEGGGIARRRRQCLGRRRRAEDRAGQDHGRIEPGPAQVRQRADQRHHRAQQHRTGEPGGGHAEQGEGPAPAAASAMTRISRQSSVSRFEG